MKFLYRLFFFIFIFAISFMGNAQDKYVVENKKGISKIDFKLLNNVIIIPIEVNGIELSFLLDSGVTRPIVFNFLKASDSLEIFNAEKIYLKGLGSEGKVAALKSSHNTFRVGDAINYNQDFYVVYDSSINFAPKLGVPIHGIIGYDLFKDLVVDINYKKQQIKLIDPEQYKYKSCSKCEILPLEFYNNKPYLQATVNVKNVIVPVKLLIDSGSSDALWLFENDSLGLVVKNNFFDDFLGFGLSGSVHGKRTKIDAFSLKSFTLRRPLVAFPDSAYTSQIRLIKGRHGSVGGEILKRFNITINYRKAQIILRRNSNFKNSFSYNKSGIEVENEGIRMVTEYESNNIGSDNANVRNNNTLRIQAVFANTRKYVIKKAYTISYVRPNSPAARVGLQAGDIIILINGKDTINYTLQELIHKFYGEEGEKIKMEVDRYGRRIKVAFNLESLIK
ncbi:PDZ domain-containing protein [Lacinutrix chionoecetis]